MTLKLPRKGLTNKSPNLPSVQISIISIVSYNWDEICIFSGGISFTIYTEQCAEGTFCTRNYGSSGICDICWIFTWIQTFQQQREAAKVILRQFLNLCFRSSFVAMVLREGTKAEKGAILKKDILGRNKKNKGRKIKQMRKTLYQRSSLSAWVWLVINQCLRRKYQVVKEYFARKAQQLGFNCSLDYLELLSVAGDKSMFLKGRIVGKGTKSSAPLNPLHKMFFWAGTIIEMRRVMNHHGYSYYQD